MEGELYTYEKHGGKGGGEAVWTEGWLRREGWRNPIKWCLLCPALGRQRYTDPDYPGSLGSLSLTQTSTLRHTCTHPDNTHTYTYHKGWKARGEFVLSNVPFRKFKLLKSSKVSLKQIEHKPWPGNQQIRTCRSHVVTSHMVVRWCGPRIHFWTWLLGLFTPMCSPLVTMGTVVPKGLTRCLTQSENIHHGCDRSGRKWLDT